MTDAKPPGANGLAGAIPLNMNDCDPPSRVSAVWRAVMGRPPLDEARVRLSCGTAGIVDSTSSTATTLSGMDVSQAPVLLNPEGTPSRTETTTPAVVTTAWISESGSCSADVPQG